MKEIMKVNFRLHLLKKRCARTEYSLVCSQSYIIKRGEKRRVVFCGKEFQINYYQFGPDIGIEITDIEDTSTYFGFHENVDFRNCTISLDTWDDMLLGISIMD